MWVGNVFSHVCVSVCVCIYLSVCLSVQAITYEPLHIETSFWVYRYILTISRSRLSIKVIGLRPRSYDKNVYFTYFNTLILYVRLQAINKVKLPLDRDPTDRDPPYRDPVPPVDRQMFLKTLPSHKCLRAVIILLLE